MNCLFSWKEQLNVGEVWQRMPGLHIDTKPATATSTLNTQNSNPSEKEHERKHTCADE
jgi:hypothetical protein